MAPGPPPDPSVGVRRLNLTSAGLGLLLAAFVLILMSFEDPFRVCLCALLLSVHGPTWRLIHAAAEQRGKPPRKIS